MPPLRTGYRLVTTLLLATSAMLAAPAANAWGPEGHRVVALIARHYLTPTARKRIDAMLAGDRDPLTAHDIASEAVWADVYRDSSKARHQATGMWHYIDLEIHSPDLDWACYGHPGLPAGTPASQGPARDCVVDKIDQFDRELRLASTSPRERLLALKFLLHLVGDLHQPLHAADNHDRGGNDEQVALPGHQPGRLHGYWDTTFVAALNPDAEALATQLIAGITAQQAVSWRQGTPADWAWQSWRLAKRYAYGELPPPGSDGVYRLSPRYAADAERVVAVQLQKAGVRLAWLLDRAFASPPSGP